VTLGKGVTFAECLPDSTQQKIRQRGPHVRYFAECLVWHSAKRASLPSARAITLGREPIPVPRSWFFTECYGSDTRQRVALLSVTLGKVTSTHLFYVLYHMHYQHVTIILILTGVWNTAGSTAGNNGGGGVKPYAVPRLCMYWNISAIL
jgi:hypothetical protein